MVRLLALITGLPLASLLAHAETENLDRAILEAHFEGPSEACAVGDRVACDEGALALHQLRARTVAPEVGDTQAHDDRGARGGLTDAEAAAMLQRRAAQNGTFRSVVDSMLGKNMFVVGYHQTSIPICHKILAEGFRPGRIGWCGGGIYFADTMAGTYGEAVGKDSHQGCIIQATINMGRMKMMGKTCDHTMNGGKLASMGYDSINFNDNAGTGQQYVIYNPSRVVSMKIVSENPNWHGPPQMQNPNP